MTFILAVFGFNQPFFFTLIGIILVLLLTLALVGTDQPANDDDSGDDLCSGNDGGGAELAVGGNSASRRSAGVS
uniref:Secreted protein n=1 Tax=Globodera pallida TaxID=36090 RepID=A0A183CFT0_GLOPA